LRWVKSLHATGVAASAPVAAGRPHVRCDQGHIRPPWMPNWTSSPPGQPQTVRLTASMVVTRCGELIQSSHPGHGTFRAAQPGTAISQWQDPVQRTDRLPHPRAAEIGAEITGPPSGLRLERDPQARRHRPRVHLDVDGAFLAPRRPAPPWQRRLKQAALRPRGLMGRIAADRFNAGDPGDHRGHMARPAHRPGPPLAVVFRVLGAPRQPVCSAAVPDWLCRHAHRRARFGAGGGADILTGWAGGGVPGPAGLAGGCPGNVNVPVTGPPTVHISASDTAVTISSAGSNISFGGNACVPPATIIATECDFTMARATPTPDSASRR
jgi:hypothetical protein